MSDGYNLPYGVTVERSRAQNIYDAAGRRIRQDKISTVHEPNGERRITFTEFDLDQFGDVYASREYHFVESRRSSISIRHWIYDVHGRADCCFEDKITFPPGVGVLYMLRSVCPDSPLLQTMQAERYERRLAASRHAPSSAPALPPPGIPQLTGWGRK